jgi:hypothetical protein
VGIDGSNAETESLGRLPIRHAGRDQTKDLDFSQGQAINSAEPRHGRRMAIALATGL